MKINIRNIALVATMISVVGAANAQSFSLSGAGLSGTTFTVAPGGDFDVEVWFTPGTASNNFNAMYVSLGFDKASNSTDATADDGKLTLVSWTANAASGFNLGSEAARSQANPSAGSNNPYGAGTGSAAARPWGTYLSNLIAPPGFTTISGPVRLGTARLHANLANGESYTGLVCYNQGGTQTSLPSLRASGYGYAPAPNGPGGGGRSGSSVYSVTAVPEPGTMIAVAAGLAALASRRRNKK